MNSAEKSLHGVLTETEIVEMQVDAVDPGLFLPPPEFEEFPCDDPLKAVKKDRPPQRK
jgi:hypothetical protein